MDATAWGLVSLIEGASYWSSGGAYEGVRVVGEVEIHSVYGLLDAQDANGTS